MRFFAIIFSGILSVFMTSVYADSGIISPLADAPQPTTAPVVVQTAAPLPLNNLLPVQSSLSQAVTDFMDTQPTPTPTPPLASGGATPTPTPVPRFTRKSSMTITLLGDSMIDTLGPDGGGLAGRLNAVYPDTTITVINHGDGGTNIDTALFHLTNGYIYLGVNRPSVLSQKPDIIVLESCGYNPYPFDTGALDKHWAQLAAIVDTIHQNLPQTKILIAATIAPNWNVFGDGAPGISFSADGKVQKVKTIDSYIESTISFAKSQHLPLADAYDKTRTPDGNGEIQYINLGDHIHYSDSGRALFAQTVANAIISDKLLE